MKFSIPLFLSLFLFNITATHAQVGINTTTPTNTLHIKGDGTTHPLRVEGIKAKGAETQVLYINSSGVVRKGEVKRSFYDSYYIEGTTEIIVESSPPATVDILTLNVVVPSNVTSQTLVITVTGYGATATNQSGCGGSFELFQNGTKLASGYINSISRWVSSTSFQKTVVATPGTHEFKVKFNVWNGSGDMIINEGNDFHDDAGQRTRMSILAYNN